jgi:hypothetical protein
MIIFHVRLLQTFLQLHFMMMGEKVPLLQIYKC